MKFVERKNCTDALQEFCQIEFAEIFFSSLSEEVQYSYFDHFINQVKRQEHCFKVDIEAFEEEIKKITTGKSPETKKYYFEQLKEEISTGLFDPNFIKEEFECWHNKDPKLFDRTKLDKYIEFLVGAKQRFTDVANKYLKGYKEDSFDPNSVISKTKQIISKELDALDNKDGWGYAFKDETDYNTFLNLLTCYFEHKPYCLPEKVIQLKKSCKTRLAKSFRPIHKELGEKLKSDTEFFKIIKILNHFENLNDVEIYLAINR